MLILSVIFFLIISCYAAYAYIYPTLLFIALPLFILVCSPVAFYCFVPLAPVTNEQTSNTKKVMAAVFVISIVYVIYTYITYE
jgi:hypothetical protein